MEQRLILFDTTELLTPAPRKLHAALAELEGRKILMPPTVALELAPDARPETKVDGITTAERRLGDQDSPPSKTEARLLQNQVWWGRMWDEKDSPYELIRLTPEQQEQRYEIAGAIDAKCFTNANPNFITTHKDTLIVCESMVLGAKMLLTSNMRSIKHDEVNAWAVANGGRFGVRAEPIIFDADEQMRYWSRSKSGLERLVKAALIACWPADDATPTDRIISKTQDDISRMIGVGTQSGGTLETTGDRILAALQRTRGFEQAGRSDSRNDADSNSQDGQREYPSYARRGSKDAREKVRRAMAQEADTPLVKGGTGPEPRDRRPMTTLAEGKKPTRKQNHGTPGS